MPALLFTNARVLTPTTEAHALLVDDGRILSLNERDAPADARRVDCGGRVILPGFIDAHGHLLSYAASLLSVDCRGARDIATLQARIRSRVAATPRGAWIRAIGYDEHDLTERRHPTRHDLDQVAPDHPVRLAHRGGHALALNSAALRACGVTSATEEPPGGYMDRELATGEPSGLFFEMNTLIDRRIPPIEIADIERGVAEAERRLLAAGVTAFHDTGASNGPAEWETLSRFVRERRFRPRLVAMTGWDAFAAGDDARVVAPDIAGGHVKLMLSELGGALVPSPDELAGRVRRIHAAGVDVAIHAVTEAGVRAAVDAIAAAVDTTPRAHRHRIEHASICPPGLAARMATYGITVVSQPIFLRVNGDRYLRTVAEPDLPHLYPFGAWERAGVALAFSSDCPVAEPDTLAGARAAIGRRSERGEAIPGEAISAAAALTAMTEGAAQAMGIERERGGLRPGLAADFVALSGDLAEPSTRVEATFIAGRAVMASGGFAERLAHVSAFVDTDDEAPIQ